MRRRRSTKDIHRRLTAAANEMSVPDGTDVQGAVFAATIRAVVSDPHLHLTIGQQKDIELTFADYLKAVKSWVMSS